MPRIAKQLSKKAVDGLKTPGMYAVGEVAGLHLRVNSADSRAWVFRATMSGSRRRDMGLGGYPDVDLEEARERARQYRKDIRAGVDPIDTRRSRKAEKANRAEADKTAAEAVEANVMTFQKAATAYIAEHGDGWENKKHRQQWTNSLATHAYPFIGKLAVSDIDLVQVRRVLDPIWRKRTETAKRLRGRIEKVLSWATVHGHRTGDNPARWNGYLDQVLLAPGKIAKVKNHAWMPINDMSQFMARLRHVEGMGARALEFAILTAARSGEVRGATWSEIDLDARIWKIPAGRMKMRKEHHVPLSAAAIELLRELPLIAGNDIVFPAPRGGALSDMTLTAVLRRMKVPVTAHGFRATFRTWAGGCTNYPREIAEMALAHDIGNKTENSYQHGSFLEKRIPMMEDWACWCGRPQGSADVTPIRRAVSA